MATNKKQAGGNEPVTRHAVRCDDPATPASGDPCRVGRLVGVALIDEDTDGLTVMDFGPSIYELEVGGVTNSASVINVTDGDQLYYNDGADPKINKDTAGVPFGIALETVDGDVGTLVAADDTAIIRVLVGVNQT